MAGANPGWGSCGAVVAGGNASDCVEDAGAASGARGCAATEAGSPAGGVRGLVCALRTAPDSAGEADTVRCGRGAGALVEGGVAGCSAGRVTVPGRLKF
jgi:hypothetical protein